MTWIALLPIIAQYGIPVAESIYKKWSSGSSPTQADFDELRALASQTAKDRAKLALVTAGIPLDSQQAITLLALVG
jgi:hypothetical protein